MQYLRGSTNPPSITIISPVSNVIWTIGQEEVAVTSNLIPYSTVLTILLTNKVSATAEDFTQGNTGSYTAEASATSSLAPGTYTLSISHTEYVAVVSDVFEKCSRFCISIAPAEVVQDNLAASHSIDGHSSCS